MIARAVLVVGGAIGLSGVIALALAATTEIDLRSRAASAASLPVPASSAPRHQSPPPRNVDSIAARNLFDPSRRPRVVATTAATTPPPPDLRLGQLTLVGVLVGSPMTAVVQGVPGAPGDVVLATGDTVLTWRVVTISLAGVQLVRDADTLALILEEMP